MCPPEDGKVGAEIPANSPYAQESGVPALLPSFVCYADILGFKEQSRAAIESGVGAEFLRHLREVLNEVYKRVRRIADVGERELFSVKVFTDNVVVGYPTPRWYFDHGESEFGTMLWVFNELQVALAMEGFLVRGGIAFGDHYMDEDIVFGSALLEAVALDKGGGPPRLALAPSAVEQVRHHIGFYGHARNAPHYSDLLEDPDGVVFLNYLDNAFMAIPDDGIFFDVIEKHRDTIQAGLAKYAGRPSVRSKFEWAARYHNFVCLDFANTHPLRDYEEPSDELEALVEQEAQRLRDFLVEEDLGRVSPRRISLEPIRPGARGKGTIVR